MDLPRLALSKPQQQQELLDGARMRVYLAPHSHVRQVETCFRSASASVKWTNDKECAPIPVCDPIKVSYPNYNMMEQTLNPFPTLASILNPRARRSLDST